MENPSILYVSEVFKEIKGFERNTGVDIMFNQRIQKNRQDSKEEVILNILSIVPQNSFSPVQIQKLFFLLDKRLQLNCFNFIPYHYGPYDKTLTFILECLNIEGKVEIKNIKGIARFQINSSHTPESPICFNAQKIELIKEMVSFVSKLSLKELCIAIYKEFPEMAQNSVFFKK